MNEEIVGKLSFSTPSWKVVKVPFAKIEGELRRLNRDYDLSEVTQSGDLYTLFFKAKLQIRSHERILRESHAEETQPEENKI